MRVQNNQPSSPSSSLRSVDASASSGEALGPDTQAALRAERKRLYALFQQAPGFICLLHGPQHVYEMANDAYYQLIGHRQILGQPLARALPEVVVQGFLQKLDRVFASGEPFIGRAMPIQLQRVAGGPLSQRYIDLIYQPIRDADGKVSGIFVQGHDVTEAHELAQEVSFQAAHDPLTGLYNRRAFANHTRGLDSVPGSHALLYMDLDHFKIVNDRCGHAAGDALLLQVAKVLQQNVRQSDILARMGGDEFALVLCGCPEEAAEDRAHVLRRAVREIPFVWGSRRYSVTLSVGVAIFEGPDPDGGTPGAGPRPTFSEALSLADAACFLAKEKGRNRVQVSHPSDEEVAQQQSDMDWVDRLKDCMREDRIVLYGQRLVPLQPGRHDDMECWEVLSRLMDVDGVLVAPGNFIPAAERFGVISDLDRHIIRKAFSRLQGMGSAQRARTRYFINISGITLGSPGLLAFLSQMLDQYCEVRPANVCFEVTETAAISSMAQTAATMRELTRKGFSFALDDFGSGMSSFAYLEKLPVQYLKIDGEFVRGILTRPTGAVIVEAVAKVAHAMDILTVAESVEHDELLPRLRELGIDFGQGFALHRPEPL